MGRKVIPALALILTVVMLSINMLQAQEVEELNKDSITCLVNKYYDFNKKVFAKNSTIEDIDSIFSLFTNDFTYVHPKYGGVYTREDLYNGYIRNQKNGAYDGKIVDVKIVNRIVGLNAIVVEKRFIEKNDKEELKEGELEMTLFEFQDYKISKIFEYW